MAAPRAVNVQLKVEVFKNDGAKAQADLERIKNILVKAGYKGWIALEYEAEEDPRIAIPEYVKKLKDNPPDKTVDKTLCVAVGSDENGSILVYGVGQIMKGKEQEALASTTQGNLFMASKLDGLKYKTEVLMDFTEAYKILGIAAPEVL